MGEGGAFFEGLRRRIAVENLDPGDRLLELLTPGMIVEHIQRYRFASGLFPSGLKILDLASGRGYGASILSEAKCKVIGLDLGRDYVKKGSEKYGKKAEFGAADVRKLPINSGSIDGVTAFEITEHLEKDDQPEFIKEIARVLKSGGRAVVSIPHSYSRGILRNVHHRYEPTRDELKLMISDAGLKIEKEMGQVVCSEAQAAKFRSRLNKPLNSKTFQYWLEGQNGKEAVANFFKVIEVPVIPGRTTLTHIFVVKK